MRKELNISEILNVWRCKGNKLEDAHALLAVVIIVPPPFPYQVEWTLDKHIHDAQGEEKVRERRVHFWLGMVGLETNERTINAAVFQSVEIGDHRLHRVANAAFWPIFHHEGKISPGW
jgi:hypothetical protein